MLEVAASIAVVCVGVGFGACFCAVAYTIFKDA